MHSLNDVSLRKDFRLKGEIYEADSLKACFEILDLNKNDLIITNSFLKNQIERTQMLKDADILYVDHYGTGEPSELWVDRILKESNSKEYQRIIAIGGGATIDIGKLCVFGDGRSVQKLFDEKESIKKKRQLIAIPTTCGTGSEVTSVAVVEFGELHSKLGLQMDDLFPDQAVLIGALLDTLPYHTYAMTSIDALAHAIESILSPKANAYTDMFAKTAAQGILENLKEVVATGSFQKHLQQSLVYANMAGVAFSIAGCAAMHALSFPLGAKYHLVHGEAVYAVMKSTLLYYKKLNLSLDKLEKVLSPVFPETPDVIEAMLELLHKVSEAPSFEQMGINETVCSEMAESVYQNQQRLLVNAPSVLTTDDLKNIYCGCLNHKKKKV